MSGSDIEITECMDNHEYISEHVVIRKRTSIRPYYEVWDGTLPMHRYHRYKYRSDAVKRIKQVHAKTGYIPVLWRVE